MMPFRMALLLLCLGPLLGSAPLAAQDHAWREQTPHGLQMTRSDLEALVDRYEISAASTGYSSELRQRARAEADLVRRRLAEGDFQVGDRIVLFVQGEQRWSDTLMVEPGRAVSLQEIGAISLQGILRSELEPHLHAELSRHVRDPVVRAESLIRLAVIGEVGRPGFTVLPASMLFEDALMAVGGPTRNADLDRLRIERSDRILWEKDELRDALVEGRTLDQLSLRAGDRIVIPAERRGFFAGGPVVVLRSLTLVLPPLIYLATRVF